jgi:SAM-dependent methyltransferase
MDMRMLSRLCCPAESCAGSLELESAVVPPRFAQAPHSRELLEGFVRCVRCRADYPVVAGVLLLPADPRTYVSAHYSLLLTCAAAEGALGPEMLHYLRSAGYELIELNRRDYSYGHQSLYVCPHYDDLGQAAAQNGGPFADFLRTRYQNFYELLLDEVLEHLNPNHLALDVGCNVGGLAYRLARHCGFVFGIDESFSAVLTARKLLLHQPAAQTSYPLPREGRRFEERALSLNKPENVEMMVADGTHLPFPPGGFDVVSCLSVLDCVPDPVALLRSLAGALRPGGILVLSDPYAWTPDSTHVSKWLGEATGESSTAALRNLLAEQFEILWEQDAVPWILRENARFYQVWLNHCVIARKKESRGCS